MISSLRIIMLCVAAAFICAAIRNTHPQIATAAALAAGVCALMLSLGDIGVISDSLKSLDRLAGLMDERGTGIVKLCAVTVLAEFASDICRDSGEASLAKRIDTGVRIAVVACALPAAGEIINGISEIMQ